MSYRPSLYPSHSAASSSTSPGVQRLLDKQREYQAFHSILAHTQGLVHLLDTFSDKYDVLDGGSEAVGDVVEHWQNVFRVTGLALASLADQRTALTTGPDDDPAHVVLPPGTLPDKLVRIPVKPDDDALDARGDSAGTGTEGGATRGDVQQ
ncbi:hypothetical protein JCM5296_000189 [Sporobolomyces johnsonii]